MGNKIISLETERLILIPLTIRHLSDEYVNWLNDKDVNRFLESGGDYTKEKLNNYLQLIESKNIFFWGIHLKNNLKHIGNIKIDPINIKHNYGEYGVLIGDKQQWGKGFAKEASLKVIEYCFSSEVDLRKINLGVNANNVNAINLYQSIGFNIEGILKKHIITSYGYDDVVLMSIFNIKYG
jgi:[ribosomal protein S5]-alanine N-acetyltransferase